MFMSKSNTVRTRGRFYIEDQGRLFVPMMDGLQKRIRDEYHSSRYYIYQGSIKKYHDLREVYWCNGMKKGITNLLLSTQIANNLT